jgi:hypothetical protein
VILSRNKHIPYALEISEDWLYITVEYHKEVAKKGDNVMAAVKFSDKV